MTADVKRARRRRRGYRFLGVATVVGIASLLIERRGVAAWVLGLVAGLWLIGFVLGVLGSWWTSGNSWRMHAMVANALGISAGRTAAELWPITRWQGPLVAATAAATTALGIVWLLRVVGRMNPHYLGAAVNWLETQDADMPLAAKVGGERRRLRVNSAPNVPRYTLVIDDEEVLDFAEWPPEWTPYGGYAD